MKIAYNPKTAAVITAATAVNDDILFDLNARKVWAKGLRMGADWADISSKPSSLKNPAAIRFRDINGTEVSYDGSVAKDLTPGTYIARLPYGFSSFDSKPTWGNTTGTSIACWKDANGGSIDFRKDNPTSGKLSIKVDGRVYVNEGANPVLSAEANSGFWGMRTPDGGNDWIRTSNNGLLPYKSGGAGNGSSSLGTNSWYFSTAYIDKVYGSLKGNADTATTATTALEAGSANKWTTARTFTIGNTAKNVDGSGNVSWSLAEIGVRDTWRTVQVNGTSIGNNTLNLCNSTYIGLTNVNGKVTFSLVGSSTTANQAILSNGTADGWTLKTLNIANWDTAYNLRHSHANKSVLDGITTGLVTNWNTAYTFVSTITGTDTDNVINKWDEIVNFLAGIKDDNKLNTLLGSKLSIQQLSAKEVLTTKTNNALFWVDIKSTANSITTGPFTDHPYALLSVTNYNQNDTNGKFFYRSRLAFSSAGDLKVASCHHENEYKQDDAWYNVLTSKNSSIKGSTITLNGTSITVYSSGTADGRYVKKSGDSMTGALNFANGILNAVGDDCYIGDINSAGCLGLRAHTGIYPGITFVKSDGTALNTLMAYGSDIKYGPYSLMYLSNGSTSVAGSTWMNPFTAYDKDAVKDGQAICVWGQGSSLSNLSSDSGNIALYLRRISASAAALNMVLDGEYYANGNQRLAHVSEIPTSLKNPHSLTLKANGTTLATYDGSSAKEANFTYANVGAASANHNHNDRYVRRWDGVYGRANKFLKLTILDEKGWIRLEVSDSDNLITGGYGVYIIGWGYHGDNETDNLNVSCLYANNVDYVQALKVVRTSRNNYDIYFQFKSGSAYPAYTVNYYKLSVQSLDYTTTAVSEIPTATWTSSLSALQLNASSATNSDKLDGYHANGLFTGLSNSGNSIKVDIGGTSKTLQVNYANSAGSATKVIVNQHIANDSDYPLVWSNQSNTSNVTENQLYKSWQDLYYNPKNKRLFVGGAVSTTYINATKTVTSAGFKHSGVTKNADQYVLTAGGGYTFLNQAANELAHEFDVSIEVTSEWQDIAGFHGGSQTFLTQPGTYIVQVYYNTSTANKMYEGYFSGVMSWYTGKTNSNNADEIVLHRAGHAYTNTIYLRTMESPASDSSPYTKLQISANTNLTQNTYKFKFKRIC